jgi:hypothetical protein
MKKPEFVYHGSPNGDIGEFTPRISMGTGEKYGPQVYASDDFAVASMFMANVGKSWSTGEVNGILYAIIPLSKEEFIKRDTGGFIYTFSGETFSSDQKRGMGDKEWASPISVKPIDIQKVDSVFSTMIDNGVQVYFVTDEQYKEMCSSGQPRWKFLKNLKSENQIQGINVKLF